MKWKIDVSPVPSLLVRPPFVGGNASTPGSATVSRDVLSSDFMLCVLSEPRDATRTSTLPPPDPTLGKVFFLVSVFTPPLVPILSGGGFTTL